jgi:cytochrome c1
MAATFGKPSYTKLKVASGAMEPCYTFSIVTPTIDWDSQDIKPAPSSLESQLMELVSSKQEWLKVMIESFLKASEQYFTKKYTADALLKHLNHKLESERPTEEQNQVLFMPKEIIIFQGRFTLMWKAKLETIRIAIPDLEENVENEAQMKDVTELLAIDDLEADLQKGPEEMVMEDSSRHYEKRKVKEARLRARLAQYKAERAMSRYLEKYGTEPSDSEWTSTSSEDESDSD